MASAGERARQAIEAGRIRLSRDEMVTVGTAATLVTRQNPNRVKVLITNLTSASGSVSYDKAVSATRGVYLGPNGGSVVGLFEEDGESLYRELYGRLGTQGDVHVLEWEVYE